MVAMLMSAPARAQGTGGGTGTLVATRVSGYTVQTGDWRLKPTIDPTAIGSTGQPGRVNSMIAVIRPEAAVGNNIRVIWFQRAPGGAGGAGGGDSWSARAWTDADVGPALAYIRQQMAWPTEDNDVITYGLLWPVAELDDRGNPNGVGPGVGVGGVPQNTNWTTIGAELGEATAEGYANGFLQGDPMGQLITTLPDRDPVVSLFTDSGYESADLVFEQSRFATGCTNNAAIQSYAATAEAFYVMQDLEAAVSIGQSRLTTLCLAQVGGAQPCPPGVIYESWTPYSCVPISSWTSANQSPYAWRSTGNPFGAQQCVYTREIRCGAIFTRVYRDAQCQISTVCKARHEVVKEQTVVCELPQNSVAQCPPTPSCAGIGWPAIPTKPISIPTGQPGPAALPSPARDDPTPPAPKTPGVPAYLPPPNGWPTTLPNGQSNPCP
jgi:hypothetical protein